MKPLFASLVLLTFVLVAPTKATIIAYDPTADFPTTSVADFTTTATNPNGAWTYEYGSHATSTALTAKRVQSITGGPIEWWCVAGNSVWSTPSISYNPNNVVATGYECEWQPHQLVLFSGWAGSYGEAEVQWTAQQAGTIDIAATFTSCRINEVANGTASIYRNNTQIWSAATSKTKGTTVSYASSTPITVEVGDTIAFHHAGWTFQQLNAMITETVVPEPSAFALMATGMLGLLAYAWRRRK